MTSEVYASLIFCEDVRSETGDKPMLIGVLSPVFTMELSPPGPDEVQLVTFVQAPYDVKEITLRLELAVNNDAGKNYKRLFHTTLSVPDATSAGDPWGAYLPTTVTIERWADGTHIEATLRANNTITVAHLKSEIRVEKPVKNQARVAKKKQTAEA